MSQFNVLYRAFLDYRKQTLDNGECINDRKVLKKSNIDGDMLQATRYLYTIETDWIKTIEDGLVYVDKCIREDRQFIRTQGEVVPIEKAKKVSKSSVEHLAKHSNLITHVPDEEQIIPDNIYIVEKLSDYTVYENRFIYMLLCYLRDFVDLRLKKIIEISNTYNGKMQMSKIIKTKIRNLEFTINLDEVRKDNPFPLDNPDEKESLDRIKEISNIVAILLQTSLMIEVSKAPMIKPPVVKTNVLRMNTNFKNALELYEYVSNYKDDGYSIEEVTKRIEPFSDEVADELSEIVILSSFLTFKHGNDIKNILKEEYNLEEQKRKEEENEKLASQIRALSRKAQEEGFNMHEYMLLLEKRNRILENDHQLLIDSTKIIEQLYESNKELKAKVSELEEIIIQKDDIIKKRDEEIVYLKQKYIDDMAKKEEEHQKNINDLNSHYRDLISDINAKHQSTIESINESNKNINDELIYNHKLEIDNLINSCNERINFIEEDCENKINTCINNYNDEINKITLKFEENKSNIINDYENKINSLNNVLNTNNELIASLNNKINNQIIDNKNSNDKYEALIRKNNKSFETKIEQITDEKYLILAQLHGIRAQYNLITPEEDFVSQERFEELENEYEAFKILFKTKWKDAKKKIKEELFATKPEHKIKGIKKSKKTEIINVKENDEINK